MVFITEAQYKSLTAINDFQFVKTYMLGAYWYKVGHSYWQYLLETGNESAIEVNSNLNSVLN